MGAFRKVLCDRRVDRNRIIRRAFSSVGFSALHGSFIALRIHGFVTEHEASIFGPVILVSFFEGENDEIDKDNCFGIINPRGGRFGVGR
jgi:hypothetical protein